MPTLMRSMQVLPYSLLLVRPHGLPRCDVLVTVIDRSDVTVVLPGLRAAVHTDEWPGEIARQPPVLIFRGLEILGISQGELQRNAGSSSYRPVSELGRMQRLIDGTLLVSRALMSV